MSPFKEPQPRKNSVEKDAKTVIGGTWPPYVREGGEATWKECPPDDEAARGGTPIRTAAEQMLHDRANVVPPLRVTTSTLDLTVRKAALEAALTHARNLNLDNTAQGITGFADIFENYLRNGKPS